MTSATDDKPSSLSLSDACCLLLIVPLLFTAGLVFISSDSYMAKHHVERRSHRSGNELHLKINDHNAVRMCYPMFDGRLPHREISSTMDEFEYSMFGVMSMQMKISKIKEESFRPNKDMIVHVVCVRFTRLNIRYSMIISNIT